MNAIVRASAVVVLGAVAIVAIIYGQTELASGLVSGLVGWLIPSPLAARR